MNENFSLSRFNNLFVRHLTYNFRSIVLFFSVFGIFMFIVFFLESLIKKDINYNSQFSTFFFWYILVGLYSASKSFSETSIPERAYQYLTLPVSNVERLLCVIFYSIFLYLTGGIILFLIVGFLANNLAASIGNFSFKYLDIELIKFIKIYSDTLLPFSIFIAGSISFRKHSFLKTILFLIIYSLIILFIAALIYRIVLSNFNFKDSMIEDNLNFYFLDFQHKYNFLVIMLLMIFIFLIWLYTYFKLKEKEV